MASDVRSNGSSDSGTWMIEGTNKIGSLPRHATNRHNNENTGPARVVRPDGPSNTAPMAPMAPYRASGENGRFLFERPKTGVSPFGYANMINTILATQKARGVPATSLTRESLKFVTHTAHLGGDPNARLADSASINPEESASRNEFVGHAEHIEYEETPAEVHLKNGDELFELGGADWRMNLKKRFVTMNGFIQFVETWIKNMPQKFPIFNFVPSANVKAGDIKHWQFDVDVETGELLAQVVQPPTTSDREEQDGGGSLRRWTGSSIRLAKEHMIRNGSRTDGGDGIKQSAFLPKDDGSTKVLGGLLDSKAHETEPEQGVLVIPAIPAIQTEDSYSQGPAHQNLSSNSTLLSRNPMDMEKGMEPSWIGLAMDAAFYIRPARASDVPGIKEIYNMEIAHGTQAVDTEPLDNNDFFNHMQTCAAKKLPFLVVVAGPGTRKQLAETVLGFAHFSEYMTGLTGKPNGSGRNSVIARLFVHAHCRQRGVGSALFHQLMQLCSASYHPNKTFSVPYVHQLDEYDEEHYIDDEEVYDPDTAPARNYQHIFVEVMCGSGRGLAEMRYERVLVEDFGFQLLSKHAAGVQWTNSGQCFLGKLVFRYECKAYTKLEKGKQVATSGGIGRSMCGSRVGNETRNETGNGTGNGTGTGNDNRSGSGQGSVNGDASGMSNKHSHAKSAGSEGRQPPECSHESTRPSPQKPLSETLQTPLEQQDKPAESGAKPAQKASALNWQQYYRPPPMNANYQTSSSSYKAPDKDRFW